MTRRIAVVLPRKEQFARDRFGAVSLVVESYVTHSAYRDATEVLGMPVRSPRDAIRFHAVTPRDRWWRRRNRGFALGVADYLAKEPPRHIDVHNRVELFTLLAERFPAAAVSIWFHNDPQEMRGAGTSPERHNILDRARHVFCVSDWVRSRFVEGISRDTDRVILLPAAVDATAVTPAPKEKSILYVGRIIEEKGVLPLAQALARILPEFPEWRVTIVGEGRKANDRYTRDVAAALAPLGDRATMPGFLDHETTMAAFARAAIAVAPSRWQEPFGRTVAEAMAAGCAVIASRRGGIPEIVSDAGILVESPDAAALAAALRRLIPDDGLRAELQQKARARAVDALDIRPWAARLDALRRESDPDLK
jgi:UDP-glucose:(glucosyl)LPS alpha-1,2-glucosyltransferase